MKSPAYNHKQPTDPSLQYITASRDVKVSKTRPPAISETYNYDAYGNAHGFNPANAASSLLYTGQMYDSYLQHYYLRARWYNPANGRFNRMDPFAGSNRDPESFHKYLYAHCNPINNIDPTGKMTLIELVDYVKTRSIAFGTRVKAAFATGGAAIGRLWREIGAFAEYCAKQVFSMFNQLVVQPGYQAGTRIIDFTLRVGNRIAQLEVKYSIPRLGGQAYDRLVGQINAMVTYGEGQPVVWSLKEPTVSQLTRLAQTLGPATFNQVQFVHGVEGLYSWICLFFGFT